MTTTKENFWHALAMYRPQDRAVVIAYGGQEGPN
jgi:hypothetical protein